MDGSGYCTFSLQNSLTSTCRFSRFSWLGGFGLARLCEGNPVGETCKVIFSAPIFQKLCCERAIRDETSLKTSMFGYLPKFEIFEATFVG